ncbi:sugar ABC transporter permease [Paenibacillus sp. J5C_2022]|uniref:carbohydrate ABC transporter permease n=1 Tax=Paenibacillus sp. J5C2022 TaxID=2977129 RepID=UPI0021D2989A|nr:sugar ABC transporter permease [Paenibacillus sp. J5C2022]MCU6708739.1 sugar ABC transporter permease [Paenibacillus sp. J5C2022]
MTSPSSRVGIRGKREEIGTALLLLAPFLLIILAFMIGPVIYSLLISFKEFSYLNPAGAFGVGFDNYTALFRDKTFLTAMKNTFKLLLIVVPLQTVFALVLANVLNRNIRAKTFFRTVYYLPYIASPVAIGAVMVYLFNRDGLITGWLEMLGFRNVAWYADGTYAFYLVAGIIVWTQIGFYTVIYLSGLQSINGEIYEAAKVDGAGSFRIFAHITVPLLRSTTFLVLVMGGLATLQAFDQPYVVSTTGGALPGSPGDSTLTMVMFLYTAAFKYYDMGYASAAAFIIFLMIFALTLVQYAYFERRTD